MHTKHVSMLAHPPTPRDQGRRHSLPLLGCHCSSSLAMPTLTEATPLSNLLRCERPPYLPCTFNYLIVRSDRRIYDFSICLLAAVFLRLASLKARYSRKGYSSLRHLRKLQTTAEAQALLACIKYHRFLSPPGPCSIVSIVTCCSFPSSY